MSTTAQPKLEPELKSGAETYSSAIEDASNYHNWILDEFRPYLEASLLEVGLGHGNYRSSLAANLRYIGIDIDEESIVQAKQKFPADRYLRADIASDDFEDTLADSVDAVLCINVLEHVEDHGKAVANLLSVIKSGGHLLLFVPAFQALYTELDSLAGHHRRYNRAQMAALFRGLKAEICVNKYFNPIGGLGWYVNGFMKHKSLNDKSVNKQIEIFDRYVLPLSRAINPITAQFFGQSLITVVRKK